MKIIIATTGSGGHLSPAIALAEELKRRSPDLDLYFIASGQPLTEGQLKGKAFKIIVFPALSPKKSFALQNIILIIKLIDIALRSLFIIIKIRPDLSIGFGGYISGPVILFSHLLSVRTVIHEQNLKLGRANRILSKFVDNVALSFEDSVEFLRHQDKAFVCGNPLRKDLISSLTRQEACLDIGLTPNRFTVLVTGGSLGARHINKEFINLLRDWKDPDSIQVIHISGELDFQDVVSDYDTIKIPHKVFSHFSKMQYAYRCSDLAVCRAGATTIAELAFFGLPAILIPYPYARGNHQLENAVLLKNYSAAILIEDDKLEAGVLEKHILGLIREPKELTRMSQNIKKFARPEAAKELADLVFSYSPSLR
ncbi:MAG: undecaprenyldiphospho-muramoylpentapeptide beta-N-acetylglucosaminyltransferase [Candidatus Omnitrophota bacterium]